MLNKHGTNRIVPLDSRRGETTLINTVIVEKSSRRRDHARSHGREMRERSLWNELIS